MARIEKATNNMYEDVCTFLLDGRKGPEAEQQADRFYRPIFNYSWQREEEHVGHVLVNSGEIVGFVGCFFVQRFINGKMCKFANLTTWKVKEENRSESIFLLMQFLKNKEYTVTGRTASREIFAIQQKLGFRCLEEKAFLAPTWPFASYAGSEVVPSDEVDKILPDDELRILRDQAPYPCESLVVRNKGRHLFIIFSLPKKRHCPVAFLHYRNDPQLFLELLPVIRREVALRFRIPLLWIESRFVCGGRVPFSWLRTSPYVHLYKTAHLQPEDIDNLYTELSVYRTLENRFYW